MPRFTITVEASTSPSLTIIGDIHVNTRQSPLPPPLYDDIKVRPTGPVLLHLESADYVLLFDVQNGSGEFKVSLLNDTGSTIASQSFEAPPQVGCVWYFRVG